MAGMAGGEDKGVREGLRDVLAPCLPLIDLGAGDQFNGDIYATLFDVSRGLGL